MADSRVEQRARELGVEVGFWTTQGEYRRTPESTLRQVVELLEESRRRHQTHPPPLALGAGEPLPFEGSAELETEGGESLVVESYLPEDLPFGYHTISIPKEPGPRMLIAAPARCHLPPETKVWGWATQLYSMRSQTSWGMGDLVDLEKLAEWSEHMGAQVIMINPVGAINPGHPVEASPYFPSSRCFRNPLYLSIDALLESAPSERESGVDLDRLNELSARARELNSSHLIERDAVSDVKYEALELLWSAFDHRDPDFERFLRDQGKPLEDFATYAAIAESEGRAWTDWPEPLRAPGAPGIAEFQAEHAERIEFHKWTQWHLDRQLARAGRRIALINDLPVGVNPAGFDAWAWNESFATGFSAGAPPDEFNWQGQDWGIAPFDPAGLTASGYEPFIKTIGAGLAHVGALRIDHVMGMFRLFWVPEGAGPSEGTYVSYPARELLDIITIESRRAGAFIVGEDLGTVEPWMRERLAERSILSYRLILFEPNLEEIPTLSLAAVTTHDLPTVAGLWTGADLEAQRRLHREPGEESVAKMRRTIASAAKASEEAGPWEVRVGVHQALARCPARIVAATLEDAVGVEERPNMPGTVEGWPNWSRALPVSLEELIDSEEVARVAKAISEGRLPPAEQGSARQA